MSEAEEKDATDQAGKVLCFSLLRMVVTKRFLENLEKLLKYDDKSQTGGVLTV